MARTATPPAYIETLFPPFFSPFFLLFFSYRTGIMVDLYGHRGFVMLLSAVFIMVVHLLLSFTTFTPIPPLIFLGLGYSWYSAAIW